MKTHYNFDNSVYISTDYGFILEKNHIFNVNDIDFILNNAVNENDLVTNNKGIKYYNIPCSFDIETSSFYRDLDGKTYDYNQRLKMPKNAKLEKLSIMYIWQFGINGFCIVGRTWKEFLTLIKRIEKHLELNENKRLIIWVHNLSFEFQFIRNFFEWSNVFALDIRQVLYCVFGGVEFRCSYLLSGYNLDTVAKNLQKYKIKKLVGNLDYKLIRHSETELTQNEILYCLNDIKIVMLYILEYIEKEKKIINLPLTKTGAVRKFCRKNCFYINSENYKGQNYGYKNLINELQINDLTELKTIQRAFAGGFTHANANYVNKTILNVSSFDFTSSYPAVMVSELYPMSKGIKINVRSEKQFENLLENYLCIFDIQFNNIFSRETFENYISISKCFVKKNFSENNGRLVCAKEIVLTITNIDYNIIKKMYSWENKKIGNFYAYKKEYLPTEFIDSILELYKMKTELKGVKGMETEYLGAKEMLNSCYGMAVTNPLRNEIIFSRETGWSENELTENEQFNKLIEYNLSKNRFLFYLWGVFVTAYARRNLFTAIFELKNDYIYSDTDSVKFINFERHKQYFEIYNKAIENKLKIACNFHGISFDYCKPKTIKGKEKLLGVWDFEGVYEKFKTLGAKRYMVKEPNALTINGKNYDYSLTVSGVNKKYAIPYLLEKYGENEIFDKFTNYLVIPSNYSGKNILTYIDYKTNGIIFDYTGKKYNFVAETGVHFEPSEYHLNLSVQFLEYLAKIKIIR
jgi:hypothetical protein